MWDPGEIDDRWTDGWMDGRMDEREHQRGGREMREKENCVKEILSKA